MCYKKQKKMMNDAFPSESKDWNDCTLRNATSNILEYSGTHPLKEIF